MQFGENAKKIAVDVDFIRSIRILTDFLQIIAGADSDRPGNEFLLLQLQKSARCDREYDEFRKTIFCCTRASQF